MPGMPTPYGAEFKAKCYGTKASFDGGIGIAAAF
jgi:hypothetical protein